MKKKMCLVLVPVALIFATQVRAQDDLVDYLVESCAFEIENYCSTVTPGEGRLLHCAAAHEDKLSGQCEYALYQAASLLEQMAEAMNYLIESCADDAEKHCSAVAAGEGRLLMCLDDHADEISDSCKTAMSETVGE
jgi:hypothetical protein